MNDLPNELLASPPAPQEAQAGRTAQTGAIKPPGIDALCCVISSLRDTAHFSDEEGELTNQLRELRDWAYAIAAPVAQPATEQAEAPDSYDAIWNALQRIDSAAAMLPSYTVDHEGDIGAFTQNIVDAITRLTPPAQAVQTEDTQLLNWLRDECCDLRCISVPTGGDDYDVRWVVIQHHMAEPREREIGESFTDDPRDAIRAARTRGNGVEPS